MNLGGLALNFGFICFVDFKKLYGGNKLDQEVTWFWKVCSLMKIACVVLCGPRHAGLKT